MAFHEQLAGLGYQFIRTEFDIDGYPRKGQTDDAVYMGLAMPVPFKAWLADRIGFGYGLYQPIFYAVDLDIPVGNVPQFILLESQPRVMVVHAALAFNVVKEGLMASDSPRGTWEITEQGEQWLETQTKQG